MSQLQKQIFMNGVTRNRVVNAYNWSPQFRPFRVFYAAKYFN